MYIDAQMTFSDDQAITADAASTNVIDLGVARNMGNGEAVPVLIQVTEDFDNLTSLEVKVQQDTVEGFGSPTDIATTGAVVLANLKAGYTFPIVYLPANTERYLRLYYDVTGTTPTSGTVMAAVVGGHQTNK